MMNKSVYEALPALYIGGGILNAVALESPVRYVASAMFIGAGLLISNWRWQARHPRRAKFRRIAGTAGKRRAG
jgi:hypothetical protein